ncbi:MAG TPA: PEP-CTERM sorting domain-containing protein [Candidatus Acidoferrum sp.]|nr:PEP-CTERM sorting domain-containing protein [Candidatus Acidoferrum sp.]
MTRFNHFWKVVAFLSFSLALVTTSRADKVVVRGASTYGDNTGFASCVDNIATFTGGGSASNCEGFVATTFTIGGTTYSGATFAFLEPGGTNFGVLDIISLAGNSTITIPLVNTSLPTGLFACGSFGVDSTVAQDSTPTNMTGLPCTSGSSGGGYLNLSQDVTGVSATFSATGVTFVNSNSTGIAVFTEDGNIQGSTTTTPEPASVMLLGLGVVALGAKLRRK